VGQAIGQVVSLELEPGRQACSVADLAAGLDLRGGFVLGEHLGRDGQRLTGFDKVTIFDVPGRAEHHDRVGKVLAQPDRPGGGLSHGLEHQHPRQHRETGEVVGKVFLGERDGLDRRNPPTRLDLDNPVEQRKPHQ
jgi:hypothetical protein